MLPFSFTFKILDDHSVSKYLYVNRIRWLGVLICIQSWIGEERVWHLGKPPVGYVRSGFICFTYFPGSSEISQKCYCYLLIFHWTSVQRLLQFFSPESKVVVSQRNNCNFKASERSFRICQGNTPASRRTVVQLLFYSAVKRGTS